MGFGIVGFGYMGQMYADLIAAQKGELIGVHDIDPAKFRSGQFYSQRLDLISHPKAVTVIICTPHQQHLPVLKECLAHKKNVILEKPMGNSEAETDEIYQEIRKHQNSSVVVVNITHCFYDPIIKAKELLSGVDVNAITSITDRVVFPIKEEERDWWLFKKEKVGHGVLLTNGCHLLARILFLFAKHHPTFEVIGGVCGNTNRLGDIEDSAAHMRLNLVLQSGRKIPVSIFANWPMAKSPHEAIEESLEMRTHSGKWHIQAWKGIVYESDPAKKVSHQVPYHRDTIGAEIEKGLKNVLKKFEQAVTAKPSTLHESVQHTYQAEKAIATFYAQCHKKDAPSVTAPPSSTLKRISSCPAMISLEKTIH